MKKPIILILVLLAGGFALPASAQHLRHGGACQPEIIITGYRSCGTPVYVRKIWAGNHFRLVPLSPCEVQAHLQSQRRWEARQALERRLALERYERARRVHPSHYRRYEPSRRCR